MGQLGSTIKNVLTLGAERDRVEAAQVNATLREKLGDATTIQRQWLSFYAKPMRDLGSDKRRGVQQLKKASRLLRTHRSERDIHESMPVGKSGSWDELDSKAHEIEAAVAAAQAAGIGAALGWGAWGAVAAFGSASTGTAIGTLAGAAATKATMAWFGAGALAAGGGGMMAGAVLLGSLVAVPFVVVGVWKYNKSVRETLRACRKLNEEISGVIKAMEAINLTYSTSMPRLEDVHASVKRELFVCGQAYSELADRLFPIPILSRIWRWLKWRFGYRYYEDSELAQFGRLEQAARRLSEVLDLRVFA